MSERKRKLDLGDKSPTKTERFESCSTPPPPPVPSQREINIFTGKPYSTKYYEILTRRKKLPVWEAKSEFVKLVEENSIVLLVGETGSGKTTQVPQFFLDSTTGRLLRSLIGSLNYIYCFVTVFTLFFFFFFKIRCKS
jgi:pre-mRNA-splicing factor ATP-dependent RNA helicase DHX15/PRP43